MILATLTRVPQDLSLVAPRGIQYVERFPNMVTAQTSSLDLLQ